jgi:hypothetical protein
MPTKAIVLAAIRALPRRVQIAAVALLIASFVGDARGEEPDWQLLRPEMGGFQVAMHGEPQYRRHEERTLAGRVVHEYYWVEHSGAKLDVERHELPRLATVFFSTDRLLDRVRDDLLEDVGAEATLEETISLQGYPGRRVVYERGEPVSSPEESRIYLVGNTLFVVATGAYLPETREPIVDRFFASFRFIESGPDVGRAVENGAEGSEASTSR